MLKRTATFFFALAAAGVLLAQDAPQSDLERRLRDLERRVQLMEATPETAEIQRQIEILTKEIEALKTGQTSRDAQADTPQHGLGAAASKVYRSEPGVSFGGYGEALYQNFDGSQVDRADFLRAILYTGYKFNDRTIFNSEIEYEHANTEEHGAVEVEFAYLDYLLRPSFNIRTGLVLMPVGFTNEQHEPTSFFAARRTQVDSRIIPTTWNEIGAGVFGEAGRFTYRAYLTTALASEGFSGSGIRGGRQHGSEAKANGAALVGRLDWHPLVGSILGASVYGGDSGQERAYGGRVTLGEVHGEAKFRGVVLRALYARGTIDDAASINAANGLTGNSSVGESFGGWYAESGYEITPNLRNREMSITPHVRYEKLDSQRSVPSGFSRNRANSQNILTLGVAFKPIPQTVIKLDWQDVDNDAGTGIDQWNIALGYIF
jgi:hypothetical protein